MDNRVGIRELQQHASAVVARVRRGEVVVVTDHGTPVAKMIPAGPASLAELVDAGLASRPTTDMASYLERPVSGATSTSGTDALRELRRER